VCFSPQADVGVEHRDPCVVVAEEPRDAESRLAPRRPARYLPEETAARSTITQVYEGTNQIQHMVIARQLLKG
jgi:alkylation response protein AidB-like acyl-CoA dehydrogenase